MEYQLPKCQQTEINVLGAMLNDSRCLIDVLATADVEHFFHEDTRTIFTVMAKEFEEKGERSVKRSVIEKKLQDHKHKKMVNIIDGCYKDYEAFQVDFDKLKNTFLNRQLYLSTTKALQAVTENKPAERIIQVLSDEMTSYLFDDSKQNILDPMDLAVKGYEELMKRAQNPDAVYGMRFSTEVKGKDVGFMGLDEVFHGAKGGDLFIIAAKTGEGKTAFACNLVRMFSLHQKYAGYYANTEMKDIDLLERIIAPYANVTVNELTTQKYEGTIHDIDKKKDNVTRAYDDFGKSNIYLSRIPTLTAQKVKALAKQVKLRYGKLDYLIVDYLGRMEMSYANGMQEYQMMFKNTQYMKELAIELDVPVFLLAQRNFDGELEGAKKIANECDGVLFFEPVDPEKDAEMMDKVISVPDKRTPKIANYKIVKKKIRRSSNTLPIFVHFNKDKQLITEIR